MMPINISFLGCCKDCPRRSPACSDRCADYQIAKAFHRAEVQWTLEQKIGHQRWVNGRKQR